MKETEGSSSGHERLGALFLEACDLSAQERGPFLDRACGDDTGLREKLARMLDADERSDVLSDPGGGRAVARAAIGQPDSIAGYRVVREIGRGGMGIVYEAVQASPERRVAIKVIRPEFASAVLRDRFAREAEVLGRLQHPGIAQIFEAGEHDGTPYIAMEYLDASSLAHCSDASAWSVSEKLAIIARVLDAAHHAHQKGIVHRDLKPENILVLRVDDQSAWTPKIVDFGIAAALESEVVATITGESDGGFMGTIAYMSPEQIERPADVDVRADIYAIGVIAYELLSGVLPIELAGTSLPNATRRIVESEPTRLSRALPGVNPDAEVILAKALSKEPSRRYESAAEFAADIRRCLRGEPITARQASGLYIASRFVSRHRVGVSATALALVALVALAAASSALAIRESEARQTTEKILYRSALAGAQAALREHSPGLAGDRLDDAPRWLRGWEWDHLNARLERHAVAESINANSGTPTAGAHRWDSTGKLLHVTALREGVLHLTTIDIESRSIVRDIPIPHAEPLGDDTLDPTVASIAPGGNRVLLIYGGRGVAEVINVGTVTHTQESRPAEDTIIHLGQVPRAPSASIGAQLATKTVSGFEVYWNGRSWQPISVVPAAGLGDVYIAEMRPSAAERLHVLVDAESHRICWVPPLSPSIRSIDVSADQPLVVVVDNGLRVRVFDHSAGSGLESERPWTPMVPEQGKVRSVRFSSKPGVLVLHSTSGRIDWIDVATGALLRSESSINRPAWIIVRPNTADGISTNAIIAISSRGAIDIWDDDTVPDDILRGHSAWVSAVEVSHDSSALLTSAWDGTVRAWNAATGEEISTVTLPSLAGDYDAVMDIAMDRLEIIALMLTGQHQHGRAYRVDIRSGAVEDLGIRIKGPHPLVFYDRDGTPHIIAREASYDDDAEPSDVRLHTGIASAAVFVPSQPHAPKLVVGVAENGWLTVVRIDERGVARSKPLDRPVEAWHNGVALAIDPTERAFAVATPTSSAEVVNIATARKVGTLEGHTDEVLCIAWSPDGDRIATGSRDGTIGIWDGATFDLLVRLEGHTDYVADIAWSHDGTTLYSASGDRTARLWKTASTR